jgi:ribonuclease P protein subunit POP4
MAQMGTVVPKEHTIFRFRIPYSDNHNDGEDDAVTPTNNAYIFELDGSTLRNRAVDRATKKFKPKKIEI